MEEIFTFFNTYILALWEPIVFFFQFCTKVQLSTARIIINTTTTMIIKVIKPHLFLCR